MCSSDLAGSGSPGLNLKIFLKVFRIAPVVAVNVDDRHAADPLNPAESIGIVSRVFHGDKSESHPETCRCQQDKAVDVKDRIPLLASTQFHFSQCIRQNADQQLR